MSELMSTKQNQNDFDRSDPLIDEVRGIRRAICAEFGNDVDRLFEHLRQVELDYAARRGVFACVTKEAADEVAKSWGEQAYRTDDPLVDEVRAIRNKLAE